jgi:hypothetical protein
LECGYDLRSEARDDSSSILFTVEGRNLTAAPIAVCGEFVFDCAFQPDPKRPARERRCPTFIIIDEDASPTLSCDPTKLAPGEAITDTLCFTYSPEYFGDCSGTIDVRATFFHGTQGMSTSKAHRAGHDRMRVLLPIN